MCASSSSSPHSCSRVIFANARLPGFPLVLRRGRGAEEGGNGRRMERGVDSILRLFRFFLHPGSHRIKQLFFPNFLTTNERAVDAVVYPRPRTKAARNLRVAHLPRFSPPSTYDSARRKSTIPGETSTLYLFPRPSQLYDSFPRA